MRRRSRSDFSRAFTAKAQNPTTTRPRTGHFHDEIKFAFIEGPDNVAIELIEDHTPRPGAIVE